MYVVAILRYFISRLYLTRFGKFNRVSIVGKYEPPSLNFLSGVAWVRGEMRY